MPQVSFDKDIKPLMTEADAITWSSWSTFGPTKM